MKKYIAPEVTSLSFQIQDEITGLINPQPGISPSNPWAQSAIADDDDAARR